MSRSLACVLPPPLVPGDRVAVVAPSSPFGRREFWRGLAWLRGRYTLDVRTSVLEKQGYLAGDDERRLAELVRALTEPGIRAVIAARGGYGATRITDRVPWAELARSPRWIVGFSDITAFHIEAARAGVATIHGPHVTGLGSDDVTPWARACFMRALERPRARHRWASLRVVHAGAPATGTIVGGNLALVEAMAAAGRLRVPEGAVLALEDVTERPYRIDRMLTSLLLGGHLARASAIVFGGFDRCDPGPDGVDVEQVLSERTRALGVPVLAGAPFGHGDANEAFVHGADVTVRNAEVCFGVGRENGENGEEGGERGERGDGGD
jgi:muramoyltetrapeptide carboxypeptidase